MKYFKSTLLSLILYPYFSYCIEFQVAPINNTGDNIYFLLHMENSNKKRDIDILLEGDSNNIIPRQNYNFSCDWGNAFGVRLSMNSTTVDGMLTYDNIYMVDSQLNVVFAKTYSHVKGTWRDPVNLKSLVCNQSGGRIKKDPLTDKDYIVDFEAIEEGPYNLKDVNGVTIKYIMDKNLMLIRNDSNSQSVIDIIKTNNDYVPSVQTVFFMKIKLKMNLISLVYWGGGNTGYYKVYGYEYDKNGNLYPNKSVIEDSNLFGYDTKSKPFQYKNSINIKKYLMER